MKKKVWYYMGQGMASFGIQDTWIEEEQAQPKPDEVLARVDAVAICASDIKMIRMGNEYPLFKDRNFQENPAILGHELSLTIVQAGANLKNEWRPGMRIGIQPDVYKEQLRYCIGVNVEGGMQTYMLLHESVFHSDHGVTIFPVKETISYASVAQLEPNACVEAIYRPFAREQFAADKGLLIYAADDISSYDLDMDLRHKRICLCTHNANKPAIACALETNSLQEAKALFSDGFEDVLILGNPSTEILEEIIAHLCTDAVFCWLADKVSNQMVSCDIAQIHYSRISFLGTMTKQLSKAFAKERLNYELKSEGSLLVMGGAGAMGRIHTLRALMKSDGPSVIAVTARGRARLQVLLDDFSDVAYRNGKQLLGIATDEADWKMKLQQAVPAGFDDVVISAPGADPIEKGLCFLKQNGKLYLFSGTSYGNFTPLPLGAVVTHGARILASSGSTVQDELAVLKRVEDKTLNPDCNVVAVAGMNAVKEALIQAAQGTYPGKVILYPQLEHLPLLALSQLDRVDEKLAAYVASYGWDRTAEKLLYCAFGQTDRLSIEEKEE